MRAPHGDGADSSSATVCTLDGVRDGRADAPDAALRSRL